MTTVEQERTSESHTTFFRQGSWLVLATGACGVFMLAAIVPAASRATASTTASAGCAGNRADRAESGGSAHLGDTAAHLSAAEHAYGLDVEHGIRG